MVFIWYVGTGSRTRFERKLACRRCTFGQDSLGTISISNGFTICFGAKHDEHFVWENAFLQTCWKALCFALAVAFSGFHAMGLIHFYGVYVQVASDSSHVTIILFLINWTFCMYMKPCQVMDLRNHLCRPCKSCHQCLYIWWNILVEATSGKHIIDFTCYLRL